MKKINHIGLVAILSVSLIACSSETPETTSKAPKQNMVNGGKTGAPITMDYKILTDSPKAGEEIEIRLNFNSRVKSSVKVQVAESKEITFLTSTDNLQSTLNKSGVRQSLPTLKIIAPVDGVYYVNLIASVEENNSIMAKPFTIAVKVGNGERILEQVGEVIEDEDGNKIIIQKAETDNKP